MIQTSYVPLEHPYQIIEYRGTMGIQIGTLIVTRDLSEERGEYAIETHSHPVVSYVNNRIHPDLKHPRTIFRPLTGSRRLIWTERSWGNYFRRTWK